MYFFYPFLSRPGFRPFNGPYHNFHRNVRQIQNPGNQRFQRHLKPGPPPAANPHPNPNPACCFNEADYKIDCLTEMLSRYCCMQDQADLCFEAALCDSKKVQDSLNAGLNKTAEAEQLWFEICSWLNRYYKRFGNYGDCEAVLTQYNQLSQEMNCVEKEALEAICLAVNKLEDSRCKEVTIQALMLTFASQCIPKC